MPFVDQINRPTLDALGLAEAEAVGDICYLAYKEIMKRWKAEPRWTTIHDIRRDIEDDSGFGLLDPTDLPPEFDLGDVHTAELLAFDVFFALHGMGYELVKRHENGDIL